MARSRLIYRTVLLGGQLLPAFATSESISSLVVVETCAELKDVIENHAHSENNHDVAMVDVWVAVTPNETSFRCQETISIARNQMVRIKAAPATSVRQMPAFIFIEASDPSSLFVNHGVLQIQDLVFDTRGARRDNRLNTRRTVGSGSDEAGSGSGGEWARVVRNMETGILDEKDCAVLFLAPVLIPPEEGVHRRRTSGSKLARSRQLTGEDAEETMEMTTMQGAASPTSSFSTCEALKDSIELGGSGAFKLLNNMICNETITIAADQTVLIAPQSQQRQPHPNGSVSVTMARPFVAPVLATTSSETATTDTSTGGGLRGDGSDGYNLFVVEAGGELTLSFLKFYHSTPLASGDGDDDNESGSLENEPGVDQGVRAVYSAGGDVAVENCVFLGLSKEDDGYGEYNQVANGGVIYMDNTDGSETKVDIRNSTFYDNEVSGDGGAIYVWGEGSRLTVGDSEFRRNRAGGSDSGRGGAIFAGRAVDVELSATSFVANGAFDGAAIRCCGGRMSHVVIEASTTAAMGGGAVVSNAPGAPACPRDLTITTATFLNNDGGGLGIFNGNATVSDTDFSLNRGTALYFEGSEKGFGYRLEMKESTFFNNSQPSTSALGDADAEEENGDVPGSAVVMRNTVGHEEADFLVHMDNVRCWENRPAECEIGMENGFAFQAAGIMCQVCTINARASDDFMSTLKQYQTAFLAVGSVVVVSVVGALVCCLSRRRQRRRGKGAQQNGSISWAATPSPSKIVKGGKDEPASRFSFSAPRSSLPKAKRNAELLERAETGDSKFSQETAPGNRNVTPGAAAPGSDRNVGKGPSRTNVPRSAGLSSAPKPSTVTADDEGVEPNDDFHSILEPIFLGRNRSRGHRQAKHVEDNEEEKGDDSDRVSGTSPCHIPITSFASASPSSSYRGGPGDRSKSFLLSDWFVAVNPNVLRQGSRRVGGDDRGFHRSPIQTQKRAQLQQRRGSGDPSRGSRDGSSRSSGTTAVDKRPVGTGDVPSGSMASILGISGTRDCAPSAHRQPQERADASSNRNNNNGGGSGGSVVGLGKCVPSDSREARNLPQHGNNRAITHHVIDVRKEMTTGSDQVPASPIASAPFPEAGLPREAHFNDNDDDAASVTSTSEHDLIARASLLLGTKSQGPQLSQSQQVMVRPPFLRASSSLCLSSSSGSSDDDHDPVGVHTWPCVSPGQFVASLDASRLAAFHSNNSEDNTDSSLNGEKYSGIAGPRRDSTEPTLDSGLDGAAAGTEGGSGGDFGGQHVNTECDDDKTAPGNACALIAPESLGLSALLEDEVRSASTRNDLEEEEACKATSSAQQDSRIHRSGVSDSQDRREPRAQNDNDVLPKEGRAPTAAAVAVALASASPATQRESREFLSLSVRDDDRSSRKCPNEKQEEEEEVYVPRSKKNTPTKLRTAEGDAWEESLGSKRNDTKWQDSSLALAAPENPRRSASTDGEMNVSQPRGFNEVAAPSALPRSKGHPDTHEDEEEDTRVPVSPIHTPKSAAAPKLRVSPPWGVVDAEAEGLSNNSDRDGFRIPRGLGGDKLSPLNVSLAGDHRTPFADVELVHRAASGMAALPSSLPGRSDDAKYDGALLTARERAFDSQMLWSPGMTSPANDATACQEMAKPDACHGSPHAVDNVSTHRNLRLTGGMSTSEAHDGEEEGKQDLPHFPDSKIAGKRRGANWSGGVSTADLEGHMYLEDADVPHQGERHNFPPDAPSPEEKSDGDQIGIYPPMHASMIEGATDVGRLWPGSGLMRDECFRGAVDLESDASSRYSVSDEEVAVGSSRRDLGSGSFSAEDGGRSILGGGRVIGKRHESAVVNFFAGVMKKPAGSQRWAASIQPAGSGDESDASWPSSLENSDSADEANARRANNARLSYK